MKSIKLPALIALILVPLLAVAALIGLTTRDDEAISAAVVNLDKAVTIEGQTVPMGRQLAAAMVDRDGDNVSWTLADAPSAAAGLQTGTYSAVVTIPKTFSAAATSFSENDADAAEQATIKVQVSDNSPVTDSQVAQQVARLAVDTINSTLTKGYLDGIYVGFNTVGEQFTTIVDGVNQLHDGSTKLADGTEKASQGATQLASGLGQLRDNSGALIDGGNQLVDGGTKLASGGTTLATGVSQLSDGATKLSDGVDTLAEQAPQLTDGVGQLADGADKLLSQIPAYADGAAQAISGVGSISDGLGQVIKGLDSGSATDTSQLDQLVAGAEGLSNGVQQVDSSMSALAQPGTPLPTGVESAVTDQVLAAMGMSGAFDCTTFGIDDANCAQATAAFNAALSEGVQGGFKAGAGAASTALNTKDASGSSLISGAKQLAAGVDQLATELPKQTQQQLGTLKAGLQQIKDGADELSTKAQPIVDNSSTIGDGATSLLDGINQLDSQIGQLPDGISQLQDGTSQLADGASQLSSGVKTYTDGVSTYADGVATYTDGVAQYADGVKQAADGADEFADAMISLSDGVNQLDEGIGTFAAKMAEGADQVPSYSQSDRTSLSTVVSSPVQQADTLISSSQVPMISLLLAAALWLGALASFVAIRPIPRDVVTSRASSLLLWARTLWLPVVIVAAQGVVMGIIGGAVLKTGIGTTVGLSALLAVAGVSFVFANHALASWFGNVGRAISVLLLAVTVALGLSSATGWLSPVATVSPLHNAFLLVRTWLAGGSGEVGLAAVAVLMAAIGAVLSIMSITARRRLTAEKFRKAA